ncbi:tetratricopeptide repeat protein [bacterium]|nr:tetratricopeptide repeat protein [bacterium]
MKRSLFTPLPAACSALLILLTGCSKSYVKNYNAGIDYYAAGDYDHAVQVFRQSIVKNPGWPDGYLGLGMAYYQMQKYDEAERQLLKAAELNPMDETVMLGLGLVYYQQGRRELAAVSFRKSFDIRPGEENTYNLGRVLVELRDFENAQPYFLRLIERQPDSPDILENLAVCYEGLEDYSNAESTWRKMLSLNILASERSRIRDHLAGAAFQAPLRKAKQADFMPPSIVVYSPATGAQVFEETVRLEAKLLADAGIENVELFVNDNAFTAARGMKLVPDGQEKPRSHMIENQIPLKPGTNEIRIRVIDDAGQSSESRVAVKRIQPKLFGLFAGISRYQDTTIPALAYADRDAEALYRFFDEQGAFEETHIKLLTNENATRSAITEALAYFLSRSAPHDLVIIFLAGHGMQEAGEYFFIAHDSQKDNLFGTAIKDVEFTSSLKRIGAKRLLLFIDTCHSGGILTQNRGSEVARSFIEKLNEVEGRITITASKFDEVSIEDARLKHGLFSYYLLDGLKGGADTNQDKVVDVMELYRHIASEIPNVTRGSQHPVIIIPEGQLVGDLPIAIIP